MNRAPLRQPLASRPRVGLLGVFTLCVWPSLSGASEPGYDFDLDDGFSTFSNNDSTLGWEFDLSETRTVTELGFWDEGPDGLSGPHAVGLWTAAGALLASVTVAGTSTARPSPSTNGQWRFEPITPIELGPGTYVIGATYASSDPDLMRIGASGGVTATDMTYVTGRSCGSCGTSLAFPSTLEPTAIEGGFGPNLLLAPPSICGDGLIEGGETCDDGGTISGDGCSDTCAIEPGYQCTGAPSVCEAQALAYEFGATDGIGAFSTGDSTLGWEFTLDHTMTVTEIGLWDETADGMASPREVGLWTSGGSLLASEVIGSGTAEASTSANGQWIFVPILPVIVLQPGSYVLGATYAANDADWVRIQASGGTTPPGLSYVTARICESCGLTLAFPNATDAFNEEAAFGPNLKLVAGASPVPGLTFPASLALVLTLCLVSYRWVRTST